ATGTALAAGATWTGRGLLQRIARAAERPERRIVAARIGGLERHLHDPVLPGGDRAVHRRVAGLRAARNDTDHLVVEIERRTARVSRADARRAEPLGLRHPVRAGADA